MSRRIAIAVGVILAGSSCCAGQPEQSAEPASLETIPPDEVEAIRETIALLNGFMARTYPPNARPALRDAHAKAHGCVGATFEVPELEARYRVGVFATARAYDAWIRFSNGSDRPKPDSEGDGRGMAIKLMGVPGPKLLPAEIDAKTQDFVMINHPVFFVDTAAHYVELTRKQQRGDLLQYFVGLRDPRDWHLRAALIAFAILRQKPVDPLGMRYWSMSPYAFGDGAMKYSATPCDGPVRDPELTARESPNFLAENMAKHLETRDACFDFAIQLRTDPESMPIEDPMVEWKEKAAPFATLARIRIPRQTFRSPEQQTFCENLSMTPWHSLPEHRPLGGINRLRRAVYETISRLRHELNGVRQSEPEAR